MADSQTSEAYDESNMYVCCTVLFIMKQLT